MIIDFHAHFFPDSIAKATVEKMSAHAGVIHYGDGHLASLLDFMKQDSISLSVNLPVATTHTQVQNINKRMIETNNKYAGQVICFGAMHPDFPNPKEELHFISENGIKGIKLHPEYQSFYPDDERMLAIYEACIKYNLFIAFHSGADVAYNTVHGNSERFKQVRKISGLRFSLAHTGAYRQWDDVERYLLGEDIYFDISCSNEMNNDQMKYILENHRADRILFGTDFPWERASVMIKKVETLGLDEELKNKLYYKNAQELLKLI